jgi:hypothetical protein
MNQAVNMSRKRKAVVITVSVLALCLSPFVIGYVWMNSPYLRGELAAYNDTRHGRYRELGYGFPADWRSDGIALVHERNHEAEFIPVAGCVVTVSLQQYVAGYNNYARRAAQQHFGHDVFEEAFTDAAAQYRKNH